MTNYFLFATVMMIPIGGFFGGLFWIMIFLTSYRHSVELNKRRKIIMCIKSATLMTLVLLVIVYLFILLLVKDMT
jgi:hypothetical protein